MQDGRKAIIAAVEALQKEVTDQLQAAAVSLDTLRKRVEAASQADAELAQLKLSTDQVANSVSTVVGTLENRYSLVSKRLEEIGAPPEDASAEEAQISADRKRLQEEKARMNGILSDGDAISRDAEKLSDHITDLRRKLFTDTLFRYTEINGQLLSDAAKAAADEYAESYGQVASSLDFTWKFKRQGLIIALAVTLVVAIGIRMLIRWLFGPMLRRDPEAEAPAYLTRLSLVFWSATLPAIGWAITVFIGLGLFFGFNVLREDLFEVVRPLLWTAVGVYYVRKLAHGIVSPEHPQWRLVNLPDRGARIFETFAVVVALINGIMYTLSEANVAFNAPVVLTVVENLFSSVIIGLLLILLGLLRPLRDPAAPKTEATLTQRVFVSVVIVAGLGLVLTALSGFIGLSQFIASQIVVTGAVLTTMYIGLLGGHAISRQGAFGKTWLGMRLARLTGADEIRLDQFGLLAGLFVYGGVLLLGLPLIMLKWGFRAADIWAVVVKLFTEIRIGNVNISIVGIIGGILIFILGLAVARWFQRWLDGNVMARSQIDVGVRNSVNTMLGYVGVAVAAMIGVSAIGIDLSSLAFVAGALSLGIGFGLQTIVQNFVSGLILLAERPFKIGDWIVNGPVEGFVRRISVRATEIETFQNQSIIVPNSQLINAAVGNWTLRNTLARSEIPVSVSYDSDPQQVMDLLLEIARAHPLILTIPEPNVGFIRFGEYSLDFELRFYLADLMTGGPVRNQIRVEIIERFRQEGIVMPVPQRELNIAVAGDPAMLEKALLDEGLSLPAVKRVMRAAERRQAPISPNIRDIDLIDDDDSGPKDGLHHAKVDNGDEDGDESR